MDLARRQKARHWVPPLNTQCLEKFGEIGERSVLSLCSLCLTCCVRYSVKLKKKYWIIYNIDAFKAQLECICLYTIMVGLISIGRIHLKHFFLIYLNHFVKITTSFKVVFERHKVWTILCYIVNFFIGKCNIKNV